jgi:large conductance mechanosensitive channel protein
MKKIASEFKEFIMTGSVIDLAVGVVIGSAFTAIVTKVVEGLITPLIALVVSLFTNGKSLEDSLSILQVKVHGVVFYFDSVVSAIITFLITGFVLFLVVRTINKAKSFRKQKEEVEEEVEVTAEDYLAEIRDLLRQQAGLPVASTEVTETKENE